MNNNKRYYTIDNFYKNKFNSKVCKVSLNANFTCPNRDGTLSTKGCIYCANNGGDFGGNINDSLMDQFQKIKAIQLKKWPTCKQIAYFQAGTNTYDTLSNLKEKYEQFLNIKDVVGISISTRSDCLSDELIAYFKELSSKTFLTIELGLQSAHDKTLKLLNRCHSLANFTETVKKLKDNNINVCVHIINSLPGETEEDMLETIDYLNELNIDEIKIHMLNVMKGTLLAKMYNENKFKLLTLEEYIRILSLQITRLKPNIAIGRISSDPNPIGLIAPNWLIKKFIVMNELDKYFKKHGLYQGKNYPRG